MSEDFVYIVTKRLWYSDDCEILMVFDSMKMAKDYALNLAKEYLDDENQYIDEKIIEDGILITDNIFFDFEIIKKVINHEK